MRTVHNQFDFDDTERFMALLTLLPGFVDSSWGNDTCPSMTHEAAKLIVWFDYADYDRRELGSHCQFTGCAWRGRRFARNPARNK